MISTDNKIFLDSKFKPDIKEYDKKKGWNGEWINGFYIAFDSNLNKIPDSVQILKIINIINEKNKNYKFIKKESIFNNLPFEVESLIISYLKNDLISPKNVLEYWKNQYIDTLLSWNLDSEKIISKFRYFKTANPEDVQHFYHHTIKKEKIVKMIHFIKFNEYYSSW